MERGPRAKDQPAVAGWGVAVLGPRAGLVAGPGLAAAMALRGQVLVPGQVGVPGVVPVRV
jgi:hypothetical protein